MKYNKKKRRWIPINNEQEKTSAEISKPVIAFENPHIKRAEQYLERLKFRKRLLGGVREKDVWRAINHLNVLYDNAIISLKLSQEMEDICEDEA